MSGPCIHHGETEDTEVSAEALMGMYSAAAAELNVGIKTGITPPCLRASVVYATSVRPGSSGLHANDASGYSVTASDTRT